MRSGRVSEGGFTWRLVDVDRDRKRIPATVKHWLGMALGLGACQALGEKPDGTSMFEGATPQQARATTSAATLTGSQIRYWKNWTNQRPKKNFPKAMRPLKSRTFDKASLASRILYKKKKGSWQYGDSSAVRTPRRLAWSAGAREAAITTMQAEFRKLGVDTTFKVATATAVAN